VLTEEEGFDTRFKASITHGKDRKALLKGVLDNTIDMITSDHNPMDIEHKKMEFDMAKDGTIGLESAFCALMTVLPLEKVEKINFGKNSFNIESHPIEEVHS
jgi:dihydroorotase